jgi:Uma2 family endonuclease
MTQAPPKLLTFDEFIAWYPENSGTRYELHNGVIVEMAKPRGKHGNVAGFLVEELILNIIQIGKRGIWTIPREAIVKPSGGKSGYEPDIIISPTFSQLNLTVQHIIDAVPGKFA